MLVPPLYGVLGSLAYRIVYDQDVIARAYAVRLYAIALGAGVVTAAYALARELWPNRRALWATLALLVAAHPQFAYSAAGGTSDVLAALWFTLLTWGMVRALRRGINLPLAAGMGIALGLGLLTKPHLFLTGPAIALLYAILWWRARRPPPAKHARRGPTPPPMGEAGMGPWGVLLCAAITASIALLFWGGWALRSWQLHGNPFYDTLWAGGWGAVENPQRTYPIVAYLADYARSLAEGWLASYWGLFGYLDAPLPPAAYRVLQGLTVLAALGLGVRAWRWARGGGSLRAAAPWLLLAVLAVTPVVYFALFNYRMWRTAGIGWPLMGRHFAGPLAAQMALWAAGLLAWLPRRARPLGHVLLRAGVLALNWGALLALVLPRYYR
jgi:hypothetical protein